MSQWKPYTYEEMCALPYPEQDAAWDRLVSEYMKFYCQSPDCWGAAGFLAVQQRVLVAKAQLGIEQAVKQFIDSSLL